MWARGWKTVTGIVIGLAGYLSQPDIMNLVPAKWVPIAKVVTACGAALAAYGVRDAITSGVPIFGSKVIYPVKQ